MSPREMSSSSSSCSPSSSAVTIPIPGKSILKRPPPTQTGILSRIKGFLPIQSPASAVDDTKPLKRAHFILPQLATVYPISSVNPPSTPTLKDEKRAIEDREAERRRRVVRGNSIGPNETEEWWNLDKVESFYRECCASREEQPDHAISAAFKVIKFTRGFSGRIELMLHVL
jgi:protein phosphatase 1 regulatory subunit 37